MEQMELVHDPAAADSRVLEHLRDLGCDPRQARGIRHFIFSADECRRHCGGAGARARGLGHRRAGGRGRMARRRRLPARAERAARAPDPSPPGVAAARTTALRRLGGRALTEGGPGRRRASEAVAAPSNGITASSAPASSLRGRRGSRRAGPPPRRPSAACRPRPRSGSGAAPQRRPAGPWPGTRRRAPPAAPTPDTQTKSAPASRAAAVHGEQEARHLLVLAHVPQLDLRGEVADEAHVVHDGERRPQNVTKESRLSGIFRHWTYTRSNAWASSPR